MGRWDGDALGCWYRRENGRAREDLGAFIKLWGACGAGFEVWAALAELEGLADRLLSSYLKTANPESRVLCRSNLGVVKRLQEVAQRGCGVSILEDIKNLVGRGPGQPVLADSTWAEALNWMISGSPFQPQWFNDLVILWRVNRQPWRAATYCSLPRRLAIVSWFSCFGRGLFLSRPFITTTFCHSVHLSGSGHAGVVAVLLPRVICCPRQPVCPDTPEEVAKRDQSGQNLHIGYNKRPFGWRAGRFLKSACPSWVTFFLDSVSVFVVVSISETAEKIQDSVLPQSHTPQHEVAERTLWILKLERTLLFVCGMYTVPFRLLYSESFLHMRQSVSQSVSVMDIFVQHRISQLPSFSLSGPVFTIKKKWLCWGARRERPCKMGMPGCNY